MAYKRSFVQQTVAATNTPQPAFSTTFNGAILAQTFASGVAYVSVPVASSAGFRVGDYVALSPGTASFEYAKVVIIPDTTHLGLNAVRGLIYNNALGAHSSGDFISLSLQVVVFYLQRVAGDTNLLYVGGPNLNPGASPPANVIASLVGVASGQPTEFSDTNPTGKLSLGTYWVYGTINTVYNISVIA